jgi:hypothetical protein
MMKVMHMNVLALVQQQKQQLEQAADQLPVCKSSKLGMQTRRLLNHILTSRPRAVVGKIAYASDLLQHPVPKPARCLCASFLCV